MDKGHEQVGEVGQAIDKHVHDPAPCPQLHRLCASEEILRKLRECDKEILAGILNQDELKPLPTVSDGLCKRAGRSGKRIVIEGEHCPRKPEGDDDSNNVPRTKVSGKSDPQSGPDNQNGGETAPQVQPCGVDLRRGCKNHLIHDAGHNGRGVRSRGRIGRDGGDKLEHHHGRHHGIWFPRRPAGI